MLLDLFTNSQKLISLIAMFYYLCDMTLIMAAILFLLFLSVFLMIVEFFFIPGTTLFGIAGFIGGTIALYFAFQESTNFGYISILLSIAMFVIFFFIGKRMMKKSNLNLESEIDGKVNTYNDGVLNVGDKGVTKTVLKPNGKALIENNKIEVYSLGEYIEKDIEIEVVKIQENKIFVKPLN